MGRILADGGGDDEWLYAFAVRQVKNAGVNDVHFLFIGGDDNPYNEWYRRAEAKFSALGCACRPLNLLCFAVGDSEIDRLLAWGNLIYFSGGDTCEILRIWEKYGFDTKLRRLFETDAALFFGGSAGAICWYDYGYSDSRDIPKKPGRHEGWVRGLGFLPGAFSPHNQFRGEIFDDELPDLGDGIIGYGMDEQTARFYDNGTVTFLCADPSCRVYIARPTKDETIVKEYPALQVIGNERQNEPETEN